jgi:hypothetical protein
MEVQQALIKAVLRQFHNVHIPKPTSIISLSSYFLYFEKLKGGWRDYLAVCVFVYPPNCFFFHSLCSPKEIIFNGSWAHSGPRPLIQFRNHFSQKVGPLGRVIRPSQGRYLDTGQDKHRINAYTHTHTHTKYPFPEWNSNPRSQRPSERRQFTP